jgi:type I restriction-modification system DNA methylase subunit
MAGRQDAARTSEPLGFEEKLWKVADQLRGSMDASEYKHVVLGLIFLKYISDTFEVSIQVLADSRLVAGTVGGTSSSACIVRER